MHHPDHGELKLYLRGRSPQNVARAIKEHLLTCDTCIREAVLEYDSLDKARAKFAQRNRDKKVQTPAPVAPPPILPEVLPAPSVVKAHHTWAVLVPMTLAVGIMLGTNTSLRNPAPDSRFQAQIPRAEFSLPPVEPGLPEALDVPETPQPVVLRTGNVKRKKAVRRARIVRPFVLVQQPKLLQYAAPPALMQDEVEETLIAGNLEDLDLQDPEALELVTTDFSVAPPPRKRAGLWRFFSALAAPFRKS